jgi:hypothetical protein
MGNVQDGHLPYAVSATFESLDSADLVRCLEGTREDVLLQVYRWIDENDDGIRKGIRSSEANAKQTPRIFWINGSAGTGKAALF